MASEYPLNSTLLLDLDMKATVVDMGSMPGDFNMTYPAGNRSGAFPASMRRLGLVVFSLNMYFIPCVVFLGFIGNALSIVVFLCTYLKRLSLSMYLAALATSDCVFLFTISFFWLDYVKVPIIHVNGVCKTVIYLGYCSCFLSVWFVVCFTIERYIAICHPLKRPEFCTTSRAKKVVLALTLGSLVGYSSALWTSGVETIGPHKVCTPLKDYKAIDAVMKCVDMVVSLIIPFLLIVILNVIIAYRISYFYKRPDVTQPARAAFIRRAAPGAEPSLYTRAQLKVTKMLLLLSSMFLLINLPSYAMRLRLLLAKEANRPNAEFFVQQLLQIIYYMTFSINFVIYAVFSQKFRDAFKRFWWQVRYKVVKLAELGRLRIFRRGESSSTSAENHDHPAAMIPLRQRYAVNTKFC